MRGNGRGLVTFSERGQQGRIVCRLTAIDLDAGIAGIAALAAAPPDTDRDTAADAEIDAGAARNRKAARAAAAARALHENRTATVAPRRAGTGLDVADIAGIAAVTARSADPDAERSAIGQRGRERTADIETARAAAAAHTLHQRAVRSTAQRRQVADNRAGDIAARTAAATRSADPDTDRGVETGAAGRSLGSGHIAPADPAAAANALRDEGRCFVTAGRDRARF